MGRAAVLKHFPNKILSYRADLQMGQFWEMSNVRTAKKTVHVVAIENKVGEVRGGIFGNLVSLEICDWLVID